MNKLNNQGSSKGARTKPLPAAGANPMMSAMVGGMGNGSSPSSKKPGKVDSFCGGGVAGGFKNRGMVNRR